ncbi:PH domain-containing protein [Falsiroseomonas sp. CW058]|uniref:PH domain-containing protein n=1 Tax=Falsiroseomonas sp. CW058 TaxID=3388664 RepID=UPI003D31ED88
MAETDILATRETKRSYGLVRGAVALLLLGLPFLGRQRIRITSERVVIESGFWTKVRDDVEVFRIRDVVSKQALWHRLLGIGDVVVKSTEGRTEEVHVLRGVPDPVGVSEAIRTAWNQAARPRTATNIDG